MPTGGVRTEEPALLGLRRAGPPLELEDVFPTLSPSFRSSVAPGSRQCTVCDANL